MKSELRQDLVSHDWILIAPHRAKRPHELIPAKKPRKPAAVRTCPFEDPQVAGHDRAVLVYGNDRSNRTNKTNRTNRSNETDWVLQIVPNKYPALHKRQASSVRSQASSVRSGIYAVKDGVGYHELLITRDHRKNFPLLTANEAHLVFLAFRDRYRMLLNDPALEYISIFHNWGSSAGASIYHPHYQIIAIPVIPPDVSHSLLGSRRFYTKHKSCVHCAMIAEEKRHKKRIICENEKAVAFAPFVSRSPFELRIFPKSHLPYFEDSPEEDLRLTAGVLWESLRRMEVKLNSPDYNFFIHTAPLKRKQDYSHYHWHIEVIPKTDISAGFELGTGIEICVVDPDEAARILR